MTHWVPPTFAVLVLIAVEAFAAGNPIVPLATFETEPAARTSGGAGLYFSGTRHHEW